MGYLVADFPIPVPEGGAAAVAEECSDHLVEIRRNLDQAQVAILDWLRLQHGIEQPPVALRAPWHLDADGFVAAVRAARGRRSPLTSAAVQDLIREHAATVAPVRALLAEAERLERRLSDLVNAAYGLTPEEVDLMWRTAPPRMPLAAPTPSER